MSTTLAVRLFGGIDVRLGDTQLPALRSSRAESLLAYLLLHRSAPQSRQHVAFRLWPDSAESQARTNLRHVLHDLRHGLPNVDAFLDIQTRTIGWRPDARLWLDAAAFEAAIARIDDATGRRNERPTDERAGDAIATLQEAVELYRGDLLPGCYDEWITEHRDRYRHRYLASLGHLAALFEGCGRPADAVPYVERLIAQEPLREDAYRLLMRLHDARGDRTRALQVYHTCSATLARELGVAPTDATRHTYEALLGGSSSAHRTDIDTSSPSEHTETPPLVGRVAEWTSLTTLWRGVEAGRAGFLLVTGEAGAGKTRLVEELRTWCSLRGAIVADARSYSAEGALAYAPVVAWLRTPGVDQLVARADRQRLSELSRLLPELLSRVPDVSPSPSRPESDSRHRLFDAIAGLLLSSGAPLLLIVDDIQWCDHETLRFLHYLLRRASGGSRLLVAATARTEEVARDKAVTELLTGLRALGLTTELDLHRLGRDATADLAARLRQRALDADDADALYRETEGNPLFVVEAVRAGWSRGGQSPGVLTPRVQAVIASRLAQLSESARELVGFAATLGRDFSIDLLAGAAGGSRDTVASALDELWRTRILRENGGLYDFSHDKIREVAYLALSPPARCQAHQRAAQALKRVGSGDLGAVSGQIAAHYDRAAMAEEAITWYEAAAEASQRLYASKEAVRLLTRALELVASLAFSVERQARELAIRTATLTPLGVVEGFASRQLDEAQRAAVDLTRALAVDPPPQLLRSLAISSLSRDDFDATRRYGMQLKARGEADGDDAILVESEYVLGISAFWKGELETARRHFEAAVSGARPDWRTGHLLQYWLDPQVTCLARLGNTLWLLGDAAAACRARDDALALADEIGHEHTRRAALVFAALLAVDMEDVAGLRRYAAALEAGSSEHDTRPNRASTEAFRSLVRVHDGEIEAGIASIRAGLDDLAEGGYAPGHRAMFARLLMAAYQVAGDVRGQLAAADEMLAMRGATLWDAEAHRVRGACLAQLGAEASEAVAAIESALDIARRQGARMLEQRALETLSRIGGLAGRRSASIATR